MPRPVRRAMLALIVVAAILAAAACGGGGGGVDMTKGLTPQQVLDRSAQAARQLTSFKISLAAKGRADIAASAGLPAGTGRLLNGPLDISGEGPVAPPDKASIDARIVVSGLPVQANVTRVGNGVYLNALGQDFSIPVSARTLRALDFGDLYPTLASWVTAPRETGREDVNGAPTIKLTGTVDASRAAAALSSTGLVKAPPAALARALKTGTAEIWVGTEDLRPRRVHLVLAGDGTGVVTGVGPLDIDLTANWSAFNEPVDVHAPANAQPFNASGLGGLLGR